MLVWLVIPKDLHGQDLYLEDFNLPSGTTVDNGPTAWSIDMSNANPGTSGFFEVQSFAGNSQFMGHNVVGEAVWISQAIDISTVPSVIASLDIAELGTLEGNDYIRVYYILDGGAETIFANFSNDFGSTLQTVNSPTLTGSTLQIIVRVSNNSIFEAHFFDNVRVYDSSLGGSTLYSRRSRNWTNRNAWSTVGLGGPSCSCRPNSTTNVVIGDNYQIRLNRDGSARNVTIQDNGRLNSNTEPNVLSVSGDILQTSSNSDPVDLSQQTLTFDGSGDQNIALNGESLEQVVVNKSGGRVILTQDLDLIGELSIETATDFASNGYLTVISTSDGTSGNASIGTIANGGMVSGNVNVQRYISGEGNIWRYLSTPVTNATVADWQDDFPITGSFADPSTGPGIQSGTPSLYQYGESGSGSDLSLGWMAYPTSGTAASNSLTPGTGYTALMLDGSNPTLVEVTGPINQGDFNFNVSFAGSGWNLLGNPYPATIDWSTAAGWSNSNVADAIYVRNNENGNSNSTVASYVDGVGTNGGTGLIATGQSFWVQAIGPNPSIQINERAKSSSTGTFFRKQETDSFFRITLSNEREKDEAVIKFSGEATFGYDPKKDAKKFTNGGINVSSLVNEDGLMAINSLPELHCTQEIDLRISKTKPGDYQISFTELGTVNLSYDLLLTDQYLKSEIPIADSTSYMFAIDANPESFKQRFSLLVTPIQEIATPEYELQALCDGGAEITWHQSLPNVAYALYAKDSLIHSVSGNGGTISATLPTDMIESFQEITFKLMSTICETQLFQQELSLQESLLPQIQQVITGQSCSAGSVVLKAEATNSLNAPIQFNWYGNTSDTTPIAITSVGEFETPKLAQTTDYYVSVSTNKGCESERVKVTARIEIHEKVQISRSNDLLKSNYQVGNQWYYNGQLMNGEMLPTLQAKNPGKYGLQVNVGNCSFYQEIEIRPSDLISDSEMLVTYPNPVKDVLFLEFKMNPGDQTSATIIDMLGKTRYQGNLDIPNRQARFDVNTLEPGVYFLEIRTTEGSFTNKFVKSQF